MEFGEDVETNTLGSTEVSMAAAATAVVLLLPPFTRLDVGDDEAVVEGVVANVAVVWGEIVVAAVEWPATRTFGRS